VLNVEGSTRLPRILNFTNSSFSAIFSISVILTRSDSVRSIGGLSVFPTLCKNAAVPNSPVLCGRNICEREFNVVGVMSLFFQKHIT